jgi:hypothetical protein
MSALAMTPLMLSLALLLSAPAGAQSAGSARLEGPLPDRNPVVSVDQTGGTVLDALDSIAKQAGWNLVVAAPESATSRPLTIRITQRPANDALNLVLEAGGLRATFADGVLKVRSDVGVTSRGAERERRRGRRAERAESRGTERVVVGKSLRVEADEVLNKAVAVGGSLTVLGHVRGDAVAVGGSVTLLPGARVEGDAVAIGGVVTVEDGASLEGDHVSVGGTIPSIIGAVTGWPMGRGHHLHSIFGFAARLARSLLLFGVALLVAAVFPNPVERVRAFLATRPALSSLGGLALLLGFIPLCVLLAMTIIGIPLIPVAVMLLIAVLLFGITVSALWLGERIPLLEQNKTPLKAVALGSAVFAVVGLIPWFGTLSIFLSALIAAGATLLSRFGRRVEVVAGSTTGG